MEAQIQRIRDLVKEVSAWQRRQQRKADRAVERGEIRGRERNERYARIQERTADWYERLKKHYGCVYDIYRDRRDREVGNQLRGGGRR